MQHAQGGSWLKTEDTYAEQKACDVSDEHVIKRDPHQYQVATTQIRRATGPCIRTSRAAYLTYYAARSPPLGRVQMK
jgi:hypothetical protein